jgi:acyl carrier protein
MTPEDARKVVADALADIAPEVDLTTLDATVDFAAEADLDSMDLLSLAEAIHERTGVDIGGGDLPPRWSLAQLEAELCNRAA